MTCIIMSYDENFNLCTCFLSVSLCSFSAFWQTQNAIRAKHHIRQRSKRFGYICVGTRKIYESQLFPTLIIAKKADFLKLSLYLYAKYTLYVRCCFHITCSAQICFMTSYFLNLARDMPRSFISTVLCINKIEYRIM